VLCVAIWQAFGYRSVSFVCGSVVGLHIGGHKQGIGPVPAKISGLLQWQAQKALHIHQA
jgi:hypothetical protein